MSKGKTTRDTVIRKAAVLFNKQGFAGVSLSDLMKATGLKKGGLYNHFANKEEIMAEAFSYAFGQVTAQISQVIKSQFSAQDKLKAVVEFYRDYPLNPTIEGGCPLVNSAVEADDTNPLLQKKVQEATQLVLAGLTAVIQRGIQRGEFRAGLDANACAILIVAQIDGGILMTRTFAEPHYMEVICDRLICYIDNELLTPE